MLLVFEEGHHKRLEAGLVGQVHAAGLNYFGAVFPGHVKGLEATATGMGAAGEDAEDGEVGQNFEALKFSSNVSLYSFCPSC